MLALSFVKEFHFLLNHGISVTLRGTRSVDPFLPSEDLDDLTVWLTLERVDFLASDAFVETFFPAAFVFDAAFFDADLVATVAFLAAAFAFATVLLAVEEDFLPADLVAAFAFEATFFAAPEALSAILAAALTFFAIAALRPASWSFLELAEATFVTESIFALTSFFAVAAPMPGSAVNASIFELPSTAIGSPIPPWRVRLINSSLHQFVTRRRIDGVWRSRSIMSNREYGGGTIVVYAQVGQAKANHRVENDTGFLRPKSFSLPSKVVYLGDVATHALAYLEHPETPHFSEPPQFNEQKWKFQTQSGGLGLIISSDAYWGFGLFNSGYLNRIVLKGSPQSYARLLFDLSASLGHRPWEFSHISAARKYLAKEGADVSPESNEEAWKKAFETARSVFDEHIFMVEEQGKAVQKRMVNTPDSEEWNVKQAKKAVEHAHFDLEVARGALADGNAPGFERAVARAEAYFIEADPDGSVLHSARDLYEIPQGQILDLETTDTGVSFVDLTINDEEE